jgi:hypothetical protein
MDRRLFLKTAALTGLEMLSPKAETVGDAVINYIEDGSADWFSVRHGWITCDAERNPNGSWAFEITIYVRQIDSEGGFMERRMVPTPLMKKALAEAGLATEFDGCSLYPSLIGELPVFATPSGVLASISQAMSRFDESSLWFDLFPDEWQDFRTPIPAPGSELWVPC